MYKGVLLFLGTSPCGHRVKVRRMGIPEAACLGKGPSEQGQAAVLGLSASVTLDS